MEELRYPIGRFEPPVKTGTDDRAQRTADIEQCPAQLRHAVEGLTDEQLDSPYRPGGWTVRQVVHHLPDSHLLGYFRFKLILTEDTPTVPVYDEKALAELYDGRFAPLAISLNMLESLQVRWAKMLRNMTGADFVRPHLHPKMPGSDPLPLDVLHALYAWHGKHHIAQITTLRQRMDW